MPDPCPKHTHTHVYIFQSPQHLYMYKKLVEPFFILQNMALVADLLLLVGFFVLAGSRGFYVVCLDGGDTVMEEAELIGLFEVMGSLLEDPSWARMHPLPCSDTPWPGVECELMEETSVFHVTKIHVGTDVTTPPCKSCAQISESLLKLPFLKTLSLMNCFTQSPVSLSKTVFGALLFLEHLALESNPSLSGQIPSTISNLENLRILRLSQNNLSGQIPNQIGGLVNLQQLDLSHNYLTGSIPEEIGSLEMLAILDVSGNSLQAVIPGGMGQLQSLEKIDLSSNKLQGTLPEEMGRLRKLILLDLSHNSLTGTIPETLSGLQQLQYLIMDDNPLDSSIPSFIESLTKLRVLSLSRSGLTGPIPSRLSNLNNLTALSLDDNMLNGTVPLEIALLPRLDALNLSRNRLSGEVPFPPGFITRLGDRLDIRGNSGLCTVQAGTSTKTLQVPSCSSAVFPAATNKTLADRDDSDVKPTLYRGDNKSSSSSSSSSGRDPGKKIFLVLVPALTSALLVPFLGVV